MKAWPGSNSNWTPNMGLSSYAKHIGRIVTTREKTETRKSNEIIGRLW